MRIFQLVPTLSYGDAVGNDVLNLHKLLEELGYDNYIFTYSLDKRLFNIPRILYDLPSLKKDDLVIYHMAICWEFVEKIRKLNCRKIAIYHNITPPHFFFDYDNTAYRLCADGLNEVKSLNNCFDYCLADSEFNKNDLISYGYKCDIDVLPILIPFEDYDKDPDQTTIDRWKNTEGTNILFVGRIAPNKKIEDVIACFNEYKNHYDNKAKLFLVGSHNDNDPYYLRLKSYIKKMNLNDVYFSGHIKFSEILSYYKLADVFLCMSEHEGFCVPLVEAMHFNVPIIAYDSCAVKETLGSGGLLVKEKNSLEIAGLIKYLVSNKELKHKIIINQKEELKRYDNAVVKELFEKYLKGFLNSK